MIRKAFTNLFAGLLGLIATTGLPIAIDEKAGKRIAGACRKVNRNQRKRPETARAGHRRQYLGNSQFLRPPGAATTSGSGEGGCASLAGKWN